MENDEVKGKGSENPAQQIEQTEDSASEGDIENGADERKVEEAREVQSKEIARKQEGSKGLLGDLLITEQFTDSDAARAVHNLFQEIGKEKFDAVSDPREFEQVQSDPGEFEGLEFGTLMLQRKNGQWARLEVVTDPAKVCTTDGEFIVVKPELLERDGKGNVRIKLEHIGEVSAQLEAIVPKAFERQVSERQAEMQDHDRRIKERAEYLQRELLGELSGNRLPERMSGVECLDGFTRTECMTAVQNFIRENPDRCPFEVRDIGNNNLVVVAKGQPAIVTICLTDTPTQSNPEDVTVIPLMVERDGKGECRLSSFGRGVMGANLRRAIANANEIQSRFRDLNIATFGGPGKAAELYVEHLARQGKLPDEKPVEDLREGKTSRKPGGLNILGIGIWSEVLLDYLINSNEPVRH